MQSGREMATGGRVSQAAGATPPTPYDGFDRMPIGGDWRSGRSGKKAADRDPYTGEILLEIELGDARDVDEAYRAAEAAQPAWAAMLPQDRRDVLDRASAIMGRRKQEIVDWLIKESGSTRRKAELEWQFTHLYMLEAAGHPFHVEGRVLPAVVSGKESRVYRGPAGVVGVIGPWNFPLHLSNTKGRYKFPYGDFEAVHR